MYNRDMRGKKIGLLGGTLDPVHSGHIALLQLARVQLQLDETILLPAGDPPHKRCNVSAADRLQMAHLAAGQEFCVSDREVLRSGRTYTVDTLRSILAEQPDCEIVYIIGADTLPNLLSWRDHAIVFSLCSFAAARRSGNAAIVPEGARVAWLEGNVPDISSTHIRAQASVRAPLAELVPPAVEAYIRTHGLYLMNMPEEAAVRQLEEMLEPRRFAHTLGVRDTAERLAQIHGLDVAATRVAGLLHDAAKCLPMEVQLRLAQGLADAGECENIELLHAPAGVKVAQETFGVRDGEILNAIRNHTLGRTGMTGLELAVFVADFIEPGRKGYPGLEEARALAERNLQAAASKCAELTKNYLCSKGRGSHPRTPKNF